MVRSLATLALCLLPVFRAWAQQPPPSVTDTADRPGFADSPILLGRGKIQIESGVAWEHERSDTVRTKTLTWPQVELHAGVASRLEFSLAWDGVVSTLPDSDGRSDDWADVRVGAKFGLLNRSNVGAALISYVDLPVGSSSVTSDFADPLVRFAWGISLSERVGFSGTADLGAARETNGRVRAKPAVSAALGTAIFRTTNGFIGIVAESPQLGSTPNMWSLEYGFVLPLGVRTQIDVWGSRRVAGGPDDWSLGAGVVRRLR